MLMKAILTFCYYFLTQKHIKFVMMMKFFRIFLCLTFINASFLLSARADNAGNKDNSTNKIEKYTRFVFDKLSFKNMQKMDYRVFQKAYYGYLNIKEAGKVRGNATLTICDFSLSSNLRRMWVIDLARKKILFNTLVAHGQGSGEEFATRFSNNHESHQTSLGFFTTGEIYNGDNGMSCKLNGIDGNFNCNAFDRAVVIHGSDYVNKTFAAANNRIGRSHGCPAIPRELTAPILNKISNGHVLFIYHPTKSYLKSSYWLNNKIVRLPQEASFLDLIRTELTTTTWAEKAARPADSLINKRMVPKAKPKELVPLNDNIVSNQNDGINLTANNKVVVPAKQEAVELKKNTAQSTMNGKTLTDPSVSNVPNNAINPVREKEFLYIRY
jgi:L,D-transpeptidase catalytic domain